jgi:hypothetical protein
LALAQAQPDTSSWQFYAAEEYGLTIKIPGDWILDKEMMAKYGDTLSFSAPTQSNDPPIGCGVRAYTHAAGKPFDMETYLTVVSDEARYLEWLREKHDEPEIHRHGQFTLPSGQKAFFAIVSLSLSNGRWFTMNFNTAEGATFFHLQCVVSPAEFEAYRDTFMAIGRSLKLTAG